VARLEVGKSARLGCSVGAGRGAQLQDEGAGWEGEGSVTGTGKKAISDVDGRRTRTLGE